MNLVTACFGGAVTGSNVLGRHSCCRSELYPFRGRRIPKVTAVGVSAAYQRGAVVGKAVASDKPASPNRQWEPFPSLQRSRPTWCEAVQAPACEGGDRGNEFASVKHLKLSEDWLLWIISERATDCDLGYIAAKEVKQYRMSFGLHRKFGRLCHWLRQASDRRIDSPK